MKEYKRTKGGGSIMKKLIILLMMAVVLVSSMSCTGGDTFVAGMELKSDNTRVTSNASQADLETLVDGNSAFAFDLYQELTKEDGNVFFSPYSISLALAMTYAGARGETESQMAEVLHFDLPQDRLHAAFNLLEAELASRQASDDQSNFQLDITNAIWGQRGFEFLSNFLNTLAENYGAGLRIADFANATEEARQTINQWANDETEGRIEELIAQGDLDPATVLVLANAIYFKALWFSPFMEEKTQDGQFALLDGSTVTVPMMEQVMSFGYSEGSDYQAIELKYKGHDFSMVVLLPNEGKFEEFEASLDAQKVEDIIGSLEGEAVILSMPKFSYDTGYDLKETLIEMGMPNAFGNADFSGMASNADLYIYAVGHKAFISVDEKGTEAAAASYVAIAGLTEMEFNMNRPFIYLIRDIETGTILFVGRVVNPSE
jgi:serpin B